MGQTVRKVKFIMSLMREKFWLEEMAQQGLFLKILISALSIPLKREVRSGWFMMWTGLTFRNILC